MAKYLGSEVVDVKNTPYANYTEVDWAMDFNMRFGQIDGGHHKQWVLDQIARILKGTPIVISLARWDNGEEEYRCSTGEPSKAYLDWVSESRGEWIETKDYEGWEYGYDEGIAP